MSESNVSQHDAVLYNREGSYIPHIGTVHDLCGYGKCSLGVAIPVLSAAGCDVCPVPTSLFSAHTRYPHFAMLDTTDFLTEYVDAWNTCPVELDAVYSGFLGAPEQVAVIKRLYAENPGCLRVLDPVMGDGGEMYATYTPELCEAMKGLVEGADILTPNLTEASILTGIPYTGQDIAPEEAERIVDALIGMGAKNVVLKGIREKDENGEDVIVNYVAGEGQPLTRVSHGLLPYMLHGTGDLYCSGLLAAVMAGKSLIEAVRFAGDFVVEAMEVSCDQPQYLERGVSFEPVLYRVTDLLRK